MNKKERNEILKKAAELKGHRKIRFLTDTEITEMQRLDRKVSLKGKRIRVYSYDGFVPNSYQFPAEIDFVERLYTAEGKKKFVVGQTDAKRSNGRGALVVMVKN